MATLFGASGPSATGGGRRRTAEARYTHDVETTEVELAYRPPIAADRLLSFLSARAVPGLEQVDGRTYRRSIRTSSGTGAVMILTVDPDTDAVQLRVEDPASMIPIARRMFDLDADPTIIDAALSGDEALAPLIAAAPGTRVPGTADGFELAVRAIVGQQVSVAGARTTLGRIVARLGTTFGPEPISHLFPSPAAIAGASREDLGVPGARAETLRELARRVLEGELDLSGVADLATTRAALASIKGVGPWTVGYISMRALSDPDGFPTRDLGVRHALAALGLPTDPRSIAERAERWRPWRAYATMHLWQA